MRSGPQPRLLVVSQTFPPLVGGTATLLSNLLESYPGDVVAIAGYSYSRKEDLTRQPPCETVQLRFPRIRLLERLYDRAATWANRCRLLDHILMRHVRRLRPDVVLAASPGVPFFISTFRVAQRLGIPFYAHMHDLWQENYATGGYLGRRELADRWEAPILKGATRVLCMTEEQSEHYRAKYAIEPEILPHTVPPGDLEAIPTELRVPRHPPTVLFVGSLCKTMNVDALGVLARAADMLEPDVELLFATNVSREQLSASGIESSRLVSRWMTQSEVREAQSSAAALVAPLSHKEASADEVRTVFSTKLLEYMVAGRPIVVFAPPDSHHARSARENGWGYVVDQDDPRALATGIQRVMGDDALAESLVVEAGEEAKRRDARLHAARLQQWVHADSSKSS